MFGGRLAWGEAADSTDGNGTSGGETIDHYLKIRGCDLWLDTRACRGVCSRIRDADYLPPVSSFPH